MGNHARCSGGLQNCLASVHKRITCNTSQQANKLLRQCIITGEIIIHHSSVLGKSTSVQIYSCTKIDQNTGVGKLSKRTHLKKRKIQKRDGTKTTTCKMEFYVEPDFGIPGAFLIENQHKNKFFLQSAIIHGPNNERINFDCRSWVYPIRLTKTCRIFFSNTSYLPSKTPLALVKLREEELKTLRGEGDGDGERKEWDRIYDYDFYNDLGNPDKGPEHARHVLGGSQRLPYPRRGRTGHPLSKDDPTTESRPDMINLDIYVPPDERLSPKKLSEVIGNSIQAAVHFLVPEAMALLYHNSSYQSFDEIRSMFSSNRSQKVEGWLTETLQKLVPDELFKRIRHVSKGDPLKFPLPQIISYDEFAWKDDEEFGRQMLAGINPTKICCLKDFPLKSRNGWRSSTIRESHIENSLDGLTIIEALKAWRIYILDHHDYLMPFLTRINTKGVCVYASRTLLFLRNDATLKPIAIELSLPRSHVGDCVDRVFLPATQGTEAALWQLAKAHVTANDSGYHQLINHWLHTHAVVEPFIIATRRQLSVMHPIQRLLDPHFKDTMHINALARSILINADGIYENTLFTGNVSMELSSALYKEWKFREQALPVDLLKRRMAVENPDKPAGVQILFDDYPYGLDGLDIWIAIKTWVESYCSVFYKDDESITNDEEIQKWWSEIRDVGHGDKRNETWWFQMNTRIDLVEVLTILIWITSAFHASVNFGQYSYAGCPPNRPMLCRKFIPSEGTKEFGEFLKDPEKYYFKLLPNRFEMTLGIALVEVLSRHASDEEYLGQRSSSEWTDNDKVLENFEKFNETLKDIERKIMERNENLELRNRRGPAKIPYQLLFPDTSNLRHIGGITGKGIPNSISI